MVGRRQILCSSEGREECGQSFFKCQLKCGETSLRINKVMLRAGSGELSLACLPDAHVKGQAQGFLGSDLCC
jgi:hypothetical protein